MAKYFDVKKHHKKYASHHIYLVNIYHLKKRAKKQVFVYSNEKWGFDFCVDEFVPSAGAYVFEDTFEMWSSDNLSSNTLASARWDHVTNGRPSDVCGIGNGAGTMMFSGANFREVETLDMDMRWGVLDVYVMNTRVWCVCFVCIALPTLLLLGA